MANNHNISSNAANSSVFRGLYNSSSNTTGTTTQNSSNSGVVQFHNQLFQNHLQQHNHAQTYNLGSNSNIQSSSNNSSSSHQFTPSTTPVAITSPVSAPNKSGVPVPIKLLDPSKHSSVQAYGNSNSNSDQMLTLVAKYWFEHNLESSMSSLEKDEHDKRMRDLRKQLEFLSETNWKYSPVDKYIGQT